MGLKNIFCHKPLDLLIDEVCKEVDLSSGDRFKFLEMKDLIGQLREKDPLALNDIMKVRSISDFYMVYILMPMIPVFLYALRRMRTLTQDSLGNTSRSRFRNWTDLIVFFALSPNSAEGFLGDLNEMEIGLNKKYGCLVSSIWRHWQIFRLLIKPLSMLTVLKMVADYIKKFP